MKPTALVLLDIGSWDNVYGPDERARFDALFQSPVPFHTEETVRAAILAHPEEIAQVEYLFSGWGMPVCDAAFLEAFPRLKAIFYAAGSIRYFATEALWQRGILVSTANSTLAITVAEFTLGQILLGLKSTWRNATAMRNARDAVRHEPPGLYDSVVGLVSLGTIARYLLTLLRHFHLRVVVYDPFLSAEEACALNVERVTLEEVFELSDVVSLHTPWLPETEGMIRGHHLDRLREGGTFINTARGAIVNEAEMIEVLRRRPDLQALLDVTWPEPPAKDSPLYDLPNVVLTPHIAGTMGKECRRMGAMALDEFERHLKGDPLQGQILREMMHAIA